MSGFFKFAASLIPDTKIYYENDINQKMREQVKNIAKLETNEKIKLLLFVNLNNEKIYIGITDINIFKTDNKVLYKTKLYDIINVKYLKSSLLESDKIELYFTNGEKETYGIYLDYNCRIFYNYILNLIKNKQEFIKNINDDDNKKETSKSLTETTIINENKDMIEKIKTDLQISIKKENEIIIEQLKENKDIMEKLKNEFDSILSDDTFKKNYSNKIDLNNATKKELEDILGIGNKLSSIIIFNRPYTSMNDLIKIVGNGKTYEYLTKITYISSTDPEFTKEVTNLEDIKNNNKIPSTLKSMVWKKYASNDKIYAKCYCCKTNEISIDNFDCGHVKSKKMEVKLL